MNEKLKKIVIIISSFFSFVISFIFAAIFAANITKRKNDYADFDGSSKDATGLTAVGNALKGCEKRSEDIAKRANGIDGRIEDAIGKISESANTLREKIKEAENDS